MAGYLPFLIACLAVIGRDAAPTPPGIAWLGADAAATVTLGGLVAVWVVSMARAVLLFRRVDRSGSLRALQRAHRLALRAQRTLALVFAAGVLGLGWLDWVRGWTGDGVLYDEALALLPYVIVSLALVPIAWGADRRARHAVLLRELGEGRPIYAAPSCLSAVVGFARHELLFIMIPVLTIVGWEEAVPTLFALFGRPAWTPTGEPTLAVTLAQMLGALTILAGIPLLVRVLWRTTPIPPGPLLERLRGVARAHRVRVRRFLAWRTAGAQVNAAVIGFVPGMRYIVLTDGLLDALPTPELEAVAAHEVAHLKQRHIPWLMASVAGPLLVALAVSAWAEHIGAPAWAVGGLWLGAVALTVLFFTGVSRRFERQADAFAAQHLASGGRAGGDAPPLTPEAAEVMARALGRVAALSGLSRTRFTWRHGSIGARQRALLRAIGAPAGRTPQDRAAAAAKWAVLAVFAAGVAAAWSMPSLPPTP